MDVTSLYTNIPHEEGVTTVCHAYEDFYGDKAPIPTKYLREILYLILTENSFQFCGSNYLQTHGTAMGTKMAVAFANIFMARIEKQILSQSCIKPLFWKRYIDDVFSLWNTSLDKIESFVKKANNFHSTIKFTAEMSETEITFLDAKVYKGVRFDKESILLERGYLAAILRKYLSEVKFADRKTTLQQRNKSAGKKLLPFVTQYHPALPSLKRILMGKWHPIQNQQRLKRNL